MCPLIERFGRRHYRYNGIISAHGFQIVEECDAETLEKRYFTRDNGTIHGHVNTTHIIVLAELV